MVKRYGSKRDKALAAKGQAAKEGRSVWETERIMDVELFLEEQTKWEEDPPLLGNAVRNVQACHR